MTVSSMNNPIDPRNDAELIRALADGESVDRSRLTDTDRVDERLAHERSLREGVSRVMSTPAVPMPADLRDRVRQAMGEVQVDEHEPGVVQTAMGDTTSTSFWSNRFAAPLALAAAVVLALTVVFVNNPSSPGLPGDASITNANQTAFASIIPANLLPDLIHRANRQHSDCAELGTMFEARMIAKTQEEAHRLAVETIEIPSVDKLHMRCLEEDGYAFRGLGTCELPGGESVHLVYTSDKPGLLPISLFVQRVPEQQLDATPETAPRSLLISADLCAVTTDAQALASSAKRCFRRVAPARLVIWVEDGLRYYLIAPNNDVIDDLGDSLGAPTEAIRI